MALPHTLIPGGAPLPQPLAPGEANRIRGIYHLQDRGLTEAAASATAAVDATSVLGAAMVGHILADRYLGRFTHPHSAELAEWLQRYGDLSAAPDIHALLRARLPAGQPLPARPALAMLANVAQPAVQPPMPEETAPPDMALVRNPQLDHDVAEAARRRGASAVLRLLARADGLSPSYRSLLAGEAARILFTLGRDEEALEVGSAGVRACRGAPASCRAASLAGYAGGLAAWRLDRPEAARALFEAGWRAPAGSSSLRASAAFWAARTHLGGRDPTAYMAWLGRASVEHYTFYGLLARRMLGLRSGLAPGEREQSRETLGEADLAAVANLPQGARAFALLQVGRRETAEAELRLLAASVRNTPPLERAVMLVADRAGFSELAAQMADLLQAADGRPREATRFHVPRLRPEGGFRIDPALVYALARTESNFDTALVSAAGARGIMQIMPETAAFITGVGTATEQVSRRLHDPEVNVDLGQRYVAYLARLPGVDADLIRMLAGYNAGPANLAKWGPGIRDLGDPLLFIESIPIDETRAFVPRVLTYSWIFADRLRLPTPSLDQLARGEWPHFAPLTRTAELSPAVLH